MTVTLRKVSVISTFSPSIDGIARYADQLVAALVKDGADVTRIGIASRGGGGDQILDLDHGSRFLRAIRCVPRDQTVLVMWHAHYLAPGRQLARIAAVASLALGFRMRRTIVLQHEPDDDLVIGTRGARRVARWVEECLRRIMWTGPTEIWFHSEYEREAFGRRYPAAAVRVRLGLITHGTGFASDVTASQAEARRQLGVPVDEQMFLCLGFLSVHKGIDRVLRAFSAADRTNARLWIVGGAIRSDEATRRHIKELRARAAEMENARMIERYVDNIEFDTWLRAADFVVLAYRSAASSSVIPRAQMMGTRVIGSGAGGTAEQLRPDIDIIAPDEDALTRVFREVRDSGR